MGADTHVLCPRCADAAAKRVEEAEQKLTDTYGKVGWSTFLSYQDELGKLKIRRDTLGDTLGESYWTEGAEEGSVKIYWSATCRKCGLYAEAEFNHQFWPESEETT